MNVVAGPGNFREDWLDQMIGQYGKALLRLCCVYLRDASLAEDAVQETFLRVYKHMDSFKGESSEKTWLFAIAVNVCRDMRKSAWFRYIDRSVNMDALKIPVDTVSETSISLMQDIMRLPRRYMEVVMLYYYADLMVKEIAEMLGLSEAAVSKRLSKARRMLRDAMEGGTTRE